MSARKAILRVIEAEDRSGSVATSTDEPPPCPYIDAGRAECGPAFRLRQQSAGWASCLDGYASCPHFRAFKQRELAETLSPVIQAQRLHASSFTDITVFATAS